MRELVVSVALALAAALVTARCKIKMSPNTPNWGDREVGIELMIAGIGIVGGSLLNEGTEYTSTKLLLLGVAWGFLRGLAACARAWGHDAAGELTRTGMLILSLPGTCALMGTAFVNYRPELANDMWHRIFG